MVDWTDSAMTPCADRADAAWTGDEMTACQDRAALESVAFSPYRHIVDSDYVGSLSGWTILRPRSACDG